MKRIFVVILSLLLTFSLLCPLFVSADSAEGNVTILFTHDLHSHFLPTSNPDGGQDGGFARLMTVINQQKAKYPNAVLVDGGDFSMGTLFQTAYKTDGLELRMLGAMGYDATTLGNHEYDYLPEGLAAMLNAAKQSGERLPAVVQSNYVPAKEGDADFREDSKDLAAAFDEFGVQEYQILERGGIYYVIFGIMGKDSDDCAPNSGSTLLAPIETAQRVVDKATAECKERYGAEPVVICLSHSGTSAGKGEDFELAQNVDGIHVIVSGHTHTTLEKPIQVGKTYIISSGNYGQNLGVLNLRFHDGVAELADYKLVSINEDVEEDAAIAERVSSYKNIVDETYLKEYGLSYELPLIYNEVKFESVADVYRTQHESTLGNLFSDAYHWAVEEIGGIQVDVALTAAGVIRESIPTGMVTVSDVFNAASLGVGTEGELIAVYITGKDLKNALEVDASVQPLMPSAQLFFSGVEYSFNTNRMIFNKVDYAMLRRENGNLEKIENDKLYCVVTGMYAGQMLGNVETMSHGLITITPRDASGNPIASEDLVNYVVRDQKGRPLKEWYSIAVYLLTMYGSMDEIYASADGRKVVYSSWNPVSLLRSPNAFTVIVVVLVLLIGIGMFFGIKTIIRRRRKHYQA